MTGAFRALPLLAALGLAAFARAAEEVPTVIASDTAEMVSNDKEATFTFANNVIVTGTNLRISCDKLVVIAYRSGDPKATFGKQEQFKSLVATGHVRILQNDREATCDRAEVFPHDDKVVLTGSPHVQSTDGKYSADGPVIELLRGEQRAIIRGGPTQRSQITLPPVKDLGYDKKPAPAGAGDTSTPTASSK